MRVADARRLMLRHNISINDMIQRKGMPIAPSALRAYFTGKGGRTIPDALARHIEEMIRERTDAR